MKTYKEILKNKIILERRQMSDDEGTNIIGVNGYGENMPNMPTSPRGPQRTREYPGIVIHSVNTYTNGGKQRGGPGPDSPTSGDETDDFTADDVNYNKGAELATPATPIIAAGSGLYGLGSAYTKKIKSADRASRLARNVIRTPIPTHQQIATRASGLNVGSDVDNWLNAEKALKAEQEALRLARPAAHAAGTSAVKALETATGPLGAAGVARTADQAEDLLQAARASDVLGKAAAAEKLALGLGSKTVAKRIGKTALTGAGLKTAGKAFMRAVPFAGAAVDLGFAAHDFSQGKYGRGLARGALAGLGFIPGVGWAINLAGNTLIDTLWEHRDVGYYQNKLIEKLDDKRYSKYMLSE